MVQVRLDEVDNLAAELNEIAGDWELFAGQLGVSRGKRKQIATNNAGKPNYAARCLVDALYCWVESSDKPSYEDIVDALTKPGNFVTSRPLAKGIIEKYGLKNTLKQTTKEVSNAKPEKSHRLKISFIIVMLFCILVAAYVYIASNSQPEQRTQTASNTSKEMCTEVQNIRLMGHYPVNATAQHNLPYLPGIFVGRDEAIVELTRLLLHHRISDVNAVAIYGPPAVGKSTLAIHFGYELVKHGVDVRYIDVQESNVFREVSEKDTNFVSDVQPTAESKSKSQLAKRSSEITFSDDKHHNIIVSVSDLLTWAKKLENETLVILDNCDFLMHKKSNKKTLWMLRRASPRLRILITSQRKVRLVGFRAFPLEFLDTESAMELLRHESSPIRLSDSDCKTICEQVDRSPLALKIAANVLSEDTSLKKFINELKNSPLKILNKDVGLPKNSTLFAVLSLAYKRLSSNTKLCGHYISNFPGSFDSVVGGRVLQMCLDSSDECLSQLVERSLVDSYHLADHKHYRLHRLIRAFFKFYPLIRAFFKFYPLIRAFFKYVRKIDSTASVRDINAMMETFNHSLMHCYSDSFAEVVQECRYDCSEEKIASLEFENHNFRKVVDTMNYFCTNERPPISVAVIMNWTTILTSGDK